MSNRGHTFQVLGEWQTDCFQELMRVVWTTGMGAHSCRNIRRFMAKTPSFQAKLGSRHAISRCEDSVPCAIGGAGDFECGWEALSR